MTGRILVTGGCGFIGAAVIRRLISEGFQVLNLDALTYAANPAALEAAADAPGYRFVHADVRDAAALAAAFASLRPDAVLHLAAETHVDRSIDGPAAFIATNVTGSFTLLQSALAYWRGLDAAGAARFRFVQVSTDEVFGSLSESAAASDEASPYAPSSPYAASKAAADHLARAWGVTYGLPVIVTNCSNNYGPWQFPEKLIPLMIANAVEGKPLPIYGAGQNIRDWLHVDDHAEALALVLRHGQPGTTYCIGGGAEWRNIEVVRAICAELDRRRPDGAPHDRLITYVADRPGHDQRYALNPARIQRELGWQPRHDFTSGLAATIGWHLDHADWWRGVRAATYDGRRLGLAQGRAI